MTPDTFVFPTFVFPTFVFPTFVFPTFVFPTFVFPTFVFPTFVFPTFVFPVKHRVSWCFQHARPVLEVRCSIQLSYGRESVDRGLLASQWQLHGLKLGWIV